jgi:hypothetical protein
VDAALRGSCGSTDRSFEFERQVTGNECDRNGSESACSRCRDTGRGFTTLEIHYGPVRTERPAALCPLEQRKARWAEVAPTPKEIWAIRIRLQLAERLRELALFNLAVDSKLRSCDLVKLRVRDVTRGDHVASRAIVMQQKTGVDPVPWTVLSL